MQKTIGVVGLGAMGLRIACRLARASFRLVVSDTDPRAVEAVRAGGGVQAKASPAAVAEACDVLITCLPHPQVVEAVYAEIAKPGLLACDCSTVGPTLAIRLPPEHQKIIAEECARWSVLHRLEVYPGAEHGFTFPERHCYHKPSAERAWKRVFALFDRRLRRA